MQDNSSKNRELMEEACEVLLGSARGLGHQLSDDPDERALLNRDTERFVVECRERAYLGDYSFEDAIGFLEGRFRELRRLTLNGAYSSIKEFLSDKVVSLGQALARPNSEGNDYSQSQSSNNYSKATDSQPLMSYEEMMALAENGDKSTNQDRKNFHINCTPKINFQFIGELEGGVKTTAYVPDPENSQSGVTVSVGFDLGARNINDLNRLGLNKELVEKLKPYLLIKKEVAVEFLNKNPLVLTKAEALEIYDRVKEQATSSLVKKYNEDSKLCFSCLPEQAQTVIASVEYQYGSARERTPKFWNRAIKNNWSTMIEELRAFGDRYPTRRNREADYLESIL